MVAIVQDQGLATCIIGGVQWFATQLAKVCQDTRKIRLPVLDIALFVSNEHCHTGRCG
jgi:hypothetical protein